MQEFISRFMHLYRAYDIFRKEEEQIRSYSVSYMQWRHKEKDKNYK